MIVIIKEAFFSFSLTLNHSSVFSLINLDGLPFSTILRKMIKLKLKLTEIVKDAVEALLLDGLDLDELKNLSR